MRIYHFNVQETITVKAETEEEAQQTLDDTTPDREGNCIDRDVLLVGYEEDGEFKHV